jgi:hypothetical protein
MPDCDECGGQLQDPRDKNASGWWRDRCLPCIGQETPDVERETPIRQTEAYRSWLEGAR